MVWQLASAKVVQNSSGDESLGTVTSGSPVESLRVAGIASFAGLIHAKSLCKRDILIYNLQLVL